MKLENTARRRYAVFGRSHHRANLMGRRAYKRPKPRYSIHFLREWRERQSMDRKQLAAETGMAPQTVGRIENRQIQLTQETIDAFTRALKIPRGALFERPK